MILHCQKQLVHFDQPQLAAGHVTFDQLAAPELASRQP
jgi:hypothetical protein